MCALSISNAEADGIIFCLHSVSGYLTSQCTHYRNGIDGNFPCVWRVVEAEVAYFLLPLVSLVEAAIRFAIGCIAACFGKGKTPFICDLAWVGAVVCLDAGLRALVALVKNVTEKKLNYEDLLFSPLRAFEPEIVRVERESQAAADAAWAREFAERSKGAFADSPVKESTVDEIVEEESVEMEEEGSVEDLLRALQGDFPEINRHLAALCSQLEMALRREVQDTCIAVALSTCEKLIALGGEHINEEYRRRSFLISQQVSAKSSAAV